MRDFRIHCCRVVLKKAHTMIFTLLGFEAVIIHTHCALLSYWMGKFGDVKVPDGPWRLLPHVFTVDKKKRRKITTALLLISTEVSAEAIVKWWRYKRGYPEVIKDICLSEI